MPNVGGVTDGSAGDEAAPLQAVLVADVFNDRFSPIADDSPFALLPLVGVPAVDYALESLALSGVQETYLFCSSFADAIKSHIAKAKNEKAAWTASMTVRIIVSEDCHSFGDALRDIYAKGFIRNYFILMGIDSVSNVKLLPLLEKHKELCKKDKGAVMTLIYKVAYPGHKAQCAGENVVLLTNSKNGRVLHHQKLIENKSTKLIFPTEAFLCNSDVEIHSDLIDTNIALCSLDVLSLFADNFDFQTKDDFVKGILMNEEILSNTIYFHKLQGDHYAARISNWQMYQTISQDIINRWVFPFAPDMGMFREHQDYIVKKNYAYRHKDSTLARGCELKEDAVIAEKTSIGEDTVVRRSVIGKNCIIGNKCEISDSFIQDNCVIEDGCHVKASILGPKCALKKKISVERVVLGASSVLSEDSKNSENDNETKKISGKRDDDSSSDSSEENDKDTHDKLVINWWDDKSDVVSSSSDDDSSEHDSFIPEDENLFLQEVIDSLTRGFAEKLDCDCLILEINSSRYAYNMSLQEVNYNVVLALFSLPSMKSSTNILKSFEEVHKAFRPIITNYIKGMDAMIDCLKAIEESCTDELVNKNVAKLILFLYQNDIITEDAILKWYQRLIAEKSPVGDNVALKKLIEWLNEASEESDESD